MQHHKITGMTLLELLFSLTIMLLLLSLSIGFSSSYLDQHRLITTETQINSQLYLARVLAYQHHQTVLICPSDDKNNCGDDWSQPWLIYLKKDGVQHLLQRGSDFAKNIHIEWHGLHSGPIQLSANNTQQALSGHFNLSTQSGLHRRLVLSRRGEVRVDEEEHLRTHISKIGIVS